MILMEIKRISGINFQMGAINTGTLPHLVVYDNQDFPVILCEEMNFDYIYKVKFEVPLAQSTNNVGQYHQYAPNNNLQQ